MHPKLKEINKVYEENEGEINKALEPFGVTFQELFMARHSKITDLELEIQRRETEARMRSCGKEDARKTYAETGEMKKQIELLIYGRIVE